MCEVAYVRKHKQQWLLRSINIGIDRMSIHEAFDEGGVSHQKDALNYLQGGVASEMEDIPHQRWKECQCEYFVFFAFLLKDWRK